ncbi:ribonuclease HII [Thiomicrospira sp. R3]|uniref:ribonuclease HII n=1 Tax=Thiomicrospira sp. R3 TaxID=3035472 RepID=UPI00259BD77B|nr:ribonuclease HII [Thiomicrospira sp. R3]WFE68353.1 ribonuclease HII [Thiomicrospira sp. R3]
MQQTSLFTLESSQAYEFSNRRIVGVDEVGRGPLIGDVVAAAVILPEDFELKLKDSKKLSHQKRLELAEQIKHQALDYAIVGIGAQQIDELNILQATLLAMKTAVEQLSISFDQVLVDGNRCPNLNCPCEAIVKGDGLIASISAASILAKVYRDQQMDELHKLFPMYGFNQHKGYPTTAHLAAIEKYGLIEGYRKSFKPIRQTYESRARL